MTTVPIAPNDWRPEPWCWRSIPRSPHDLAAKLSRLAGHSRVLLENALRHVTHRDPHGRSAANTRAAMGLRLALAQHDDYLSATEPQPRR